jgi:hypothetical protein
MRMKFDFLLHLYNKKEWSLRTFGPGSRHKGIVAHIRKELEEIERDPSDLEEWIDVVILALDGAWRTGASPEMIVACLQAKTIKNMKRTWQDWRKLTEDDPIEHVRGSKDAGVG